MWIQNHTQSKNEESIFTFSRISIFTFSRISIFTFYVHAHTLNQEIWYDDALVTFYVDAILHSMLMLCHILCWCSCPKSRDMVCWCFGHILCWCYTTFYVDAMSHSMLMLMSQIQRHSMLMLVSHSILMLMSQIQRHGMVIHMSYSI